MLSLAYFIYCLTFQGSQSLIWGVGWKRESIPGLLFAEMASFCMSSVSCGREFIFHGERQAWRDGGRWDEASAGPDPLRKLSISGSWRWSVSSPSSWPWADMMSVSSSRGIHCNLTLLKEDRIRLKQEWCITVTVHQAFGMHEAKKPSLTMRMIKFHERKRDYWQMEDTKETHPWGARKYRGAPLYPFSKGTFKDLLP